MSTAAERMNPYLVALHEGDLVGFALDYLRNMGLHAAPVLDDDRCPVGVATLPDLAGLPAHVAVGTSCRGEVVSVEDSATLREVAELIDDTGLHHVVVVRDGRAVGILSAVDVVRGLIGSRSVHLPVVEVFGGVAATDATWSPTEWLTHDTAEVAPPVPGLLVVRSGGEAEPGRVLRAARTPDVRAALREFLENPPEVARWSEGWGPPRFQFKAI